MKRSHTRIMVEGALMIALSTALSLYAVVKLPNGGSITLASMVPLILMSYRHGLKWGLLTSFVHSLIQMLLGFYAPPTQNVISFVLVIFLDYIIAFTALGGMCIFKNISKNKRTGIAVGTVAVTFVRYLCSFLSGILIWSVYAPPEQPVWLYSLVYNGSYMIPEIIISTVVMLLLCPALERRHLLGAQIA